LGGSTTLETTPYLYDAGHCTEEREAQGQRVGCLNPRRLLKAEPTTLWPGEANSVGEGPLFFFTFL